MKIETVSVAKYNKKHEIVEEKSEYFQAIIIDVLYFCCRLSFEFMKLRLEFNTTSI